MDQLPALNLFRMLAHAETVFPPFLQMAASILTAMRLDPGLRELAILQVAKQAEAEYEWLQNVEIGRHAGLSDAQIAAVSSGQIESQEVFTSAERSVLAFTAAVVEGPRVSAALIDDICTHLDPREIVELLLAIGNYSMLARIMTALEIEIDPPASTGPVLSRKDPG
jgi:4-carboxymuconolactone decarboxylase